MQYAEKPIYAQRKVIISKLLFLDSYTANYFYHNNFSTEYTHVRFSLRLACFNETEADQDCGEKGCGDCGM